MDKTDLAAVYRTMLRIRRFDEGVADLFKEGLVKGTATATAGRKPSPPAPR
jgi:TPP-dependent pyruvate/acetoin dehydrogenase alpha subunit